MTETPKSLPDLERLEELAKAAKPILPVASALDLEDPNALRVYFLPGVLTKENRETFTEYALAAQPFYVLSLLSRIRELEGALRRIRGYTRDRTEDVTLPRTAIGVIRMIADDTLAALNLLPGEGEG